MINIEPRTFTCATNNQTVSQKCTFIPGKYEVDNVAAYAVPILHFNNNDD
jgi:hypothetical protein